MKLSDLEQFSPLVKDYVSRFDSSDVRRFFPLAPNTHAEAFLAFLKRRAESWEGNTAVRAAIPKLLEQQHEANGTLDGAVRANIQLLAEPNTLAIVTGQQVGLFGGPLYSLYKTISAIQLSRELASAHPEYHFVPIFWLETEDHDIEESTTIGVLDREYVYRAIRYEPTDYPQPLSEASKTWRRQIGPLPVEPTALAKSIDQLRAALPATEFTDDVLGAFERCYQNHTTFATAFAQLLQLLFADEGLLVLDANDRVAKGLARALFARELTTSPELSERIVHQTAQLEERYHAQVKPRALNLFYLDGGERYPLLEKEATDPAQPRTFILQPTKRTLTLDELLGKIENEPERFSPNVVLRPLYQDFLLPTVAYVAGPGEIAYFAQFKTAYDWAGIPMPLIVPRLTATIVEDRFRALLDSASLTVEDILQGGSMRVQRLLESLSDAELAPAFEQAMMEIERELESLRPHVERADKTLNDALTSLKGKLVTAVRDFQSKTLAADRKRHATVRAKFEKLLAALLPREALQERELSILFFLNKYGFDFWRDLKQDLLSQPVNADEHRVLFVSEFHAHDRSVGATTDNAGDKRTSEPARSLVAVPAE